MKSLIYITSIIFLLVLTVQCKGEVSIVVPEKPVWGDTIEVIYNTADKQAKLFPGDSIYIISFVFFEDSTEQRWGKMQKEGNTFRYRMFIEKGMAFLEFYFITLDSWDRETMASTMIYKNNVIPAKGAYIHQMLNYGVDNKYLEFFQKEMEFYPDNYGAYRHKWFIQNYLEADNIATVVKQEIEMLKNKVKVESVDFLYSLSYGYMLLGNEEESRSIIQKIVEKYPESFYTGQAINDYEYNVYSKQIKGDGPKQVEKIKLGLVEKYPSTQYSRQEIENLSFNMEIPINSIEVVCELWMKDEPDNPIPYFSLARAYYRRKQKLDKASDLITKAINLNLQGKLRLYNDVSGQMSQIELPMYFMCSADIQLELGNYARALADVKTAEKISDEPVSWYYNQEANIWYRMGIYSRAEDNFLEAFRLGFGSAKDSLKTIYLKRHETIEGFDEYFNQKLEKHKSKASENKEKSPDFDVKTLDGKKLHTKDLKGKVIVVNFWSTGCVPCKVEIPNLNLLVDEFKDEDVVFIAFAIDNDKKIVKKFLEKIPFKYNIVIDNGKLAKQFRAKALPTHIIINKNGEIVFRLTGGSEDIHTYLKPLIIDALK